MDNNYRYTIKCRGCSRMTVIHFKNVDNYPFTKFIREYSNFPLTKTCVCNPDGDMLLHDLVSYNNK